MTPTPQAAPIRTFAAVELPHSVKRPLARAADELRALCIPGLRVVRPEGIHITLKFLGDIDPARVPDIADALAAAADSHPPFSLAVGAPGAFPNPTRPRVLWLGVAGDAPALDALRALQRDTDAALAAIGFPPEKQPFSPHLTIARMRRPDAAALAALSALNLPSGAAIPVNAVSLMQSSLNPGGAIYTRLRSAPLADAGQRPTQRPP